MNMERATGASDEQTTHADKRHELRRLARKGVRTYLGLWGLAFDRITSNAINIAQQGIAFSQSAEERGEEVEQAMRAQLGGLEQQAITGLVWLRERIDEQLASNRQPAIDQPTPIPIVPTSTQPTSPTLATGRLVSDAAEVRQLMTPLPLANYDQLMAKQVIDQLVGLTVDELKAIQTYEQNQARRITVLRAIDQTLRRKLAIL